MWSPERRHLLVAAIVATVFVSACGPSPSPPPPAPEPDPATSAVGPNTHRYSGTNTNFWTVVAASPPANKPGSESEAEQDARKLETQGIAAYWAPSTTWSSLRPGYIVVFAGESRTLKQAEGLLHAVRDAGFADAYTRHFGASTSGGSAAGGSDGDGSSSDGGSANAGGSDDGGSGGGDAVLLRDDFSGPFPGGFWEVSGPVKIDKTVGKGAPALAVGEPQSADPPPTSEGGVGFASNNGNGWVRSLGTFSSDEGFTLSFDLLTKGGDASVGLKDVSSDQWSQDRTGVSLRTSSSSGAFMIGSAGVNTGPPPVGSWHHYEFRVSDRTATWSRDGGARFSHAYGPHNVYVTLYGGGNQTVWFDNISVTSP